MAELKVEVEGRYIIVTMPGTSYRASYFKSSGAPGLMQSDYTEDDKEAILSRNEFIALAWDAANAKARYKGSIPSLRAVADCFSERITVLEASLQGGADMAPTCQYVRQWTHFGH